MWLKPTDERRGDFRTRARGREEIRPRERRSISGRCIGPSAMAPTSVPPDPESTRFCLSIYEAPLTNPTGVSITRSPYRKPTAETMPIDAKAGCLYPNNARALMEANARGFDNCLLADMLGNVAELATANVFMAKDGVIMTPMANGIVPQRRDAPARVETAARGRQATCARRRWASPISTRRMRFSSSAISAKSRPVRRIDAARPAARPGLSPRARALLGIRAFGVRDARGLRRPSSDAGAVLPLAGRRVRTPCSVCWRECTVGEGRS